MNRVKAQRGKAKKTDKAQAVSPTYRVVITEDNKKEEAVRLMAMIRAKRDCGTNT